MSESLTKSLRPGRFRTHLEGLEGEFESMVQEIEALKQERDQYKAEIEAYAKKLEDVRRQIGCDQCQEKNMGASQLIAPSQSKTTRISSSLLSTFVSQSKSLQKPKTLQGAITSRQIGGSVQSSILSPAVEPTRLSKSESQTTTLSAETTIANFVPSPSSQLPTLALDPSVDADWSITSGNQVRKELNVELAHIFFHEEAVWSVKFSHDGKFLATGCGDGKAYIYDVQTGILTSVLRNLLAEHDHTRAVCFSRDGKYLATASSDDSIYIWEIKAKYVRNSFKGHTASATTLCFSPNSRLLLSTSRDETTRLWNMRYGSTMVLTTEKSSPYVGVPSAVFSPNGRYIAACSNDGQVLIWDAYTGRLIRKLMVNETLYDIAVMPDGSALLSGSSGRNMMYWDISSLVDTRSPATRPQMTKNLGEHDSEVTEQTRPDRVFPGHTGPVYSLAITADGRWAASATYDHSVRIWDTRSAAIQCTLSTSEWMRSVDFSPAGSFVAAGGFDGTLRIWRYSSIRGASDTR